MPGRFGHEERFWGRVVGASAKHDLWAHALDLISIKERRPLAKEHGFFDACDTREAESKGQINANWKRRKPLSFPPSVKMRTA